MFGRFLFYGGIAAALTFPFAYDVGYEASKNDLLQKSQLEKLAEDKYKVRNPDDGLDYFVNFEDKNIGLYTKEVEKLFR